MKGFFDLPEPAPAAKGRKGRPLNCETCGLYKDVKSPKMPVGGRGEMGILMFAEAPGATEDAQGTQLVGKMGKVLEATIKPMGVDLHIDCFKINAVDCRPPGNRTPTTLEIDCCRARKWEAIRELQPELIIPLGNAAMESFLGDRWRKKLGGINRWRGWHIPDRNAGAWVCPTFHPSYVDRSLNKKQFIVKAMFTNDLKAAIVQLDKPFPEFSDEASKVQVIMEPSKIITELLRISSGDYMYTYPFIAFDYEATGLKPYLPEHEIKCAAIATGEDTAIAFPMDNEGVIATLSNLLADSTIKKVAHNAKFEHVWSKVKLDTEVRGWQSCTMNTAHILDNRPKITGLKFQAYVRYGVIDYDGKVQPYLESNKKDANSFNRIDDFIERYGFEELARYCGQDAMFTYRLAYDQRRELRPYQKAHELFHRGMLSFARTEMNGIPLDEPYCEGEIDRLGSRIERMEERLLDSKLGQAWREWARKAKEKINLASNPQLGKVLFNEMKIEPPLLTDKGNASVSEEALGMVKLPEVKGVLDIRTQKNLRNTTMKGLLREAAGQGVVHPFFNLNVPVSFRSSSTNPNGQNIPVRNPRSKRIARTAITPRPGFLLLEADYSGIEVHVSACIHKDPMLIKYVKNPTTDMHRDMAQEIYMLDEAEVSSATRYSAKSAFVFPQFYGDWYKKCAMALWKYIDEFKLKVEGEDLGLREHLKEQGIKSYMDFEVHLQDVENEFWGERFQVYSQWKEDHWMRYQREGYFDIATGFRVSSGKAGPLTRNEATNYPIQGPAFHCLLWSYNRLDEIIIEEQWRSRLIGQIHDSIIMDVHPDELDMVLKTVRQVTCKDLLKEWDWIIVPLDVDAEVSKIDGTWADMSAIEI